VGRGQPPRTDHVREQGDRKGRPYNIRTGLHGALGYGTRATQEGDHKGRPYHGRMGDASVPTPFHTTPAPTSLTTCLEKPTCVKPPPPLWVGSAPDHSKGIGVWRKLELPFSLTADRQLHRRNSGPYRLCWQPGATSLDHNQLSINVAQECKVLRDGASIWLDIEGLLQYRCQCGHILDWQTNLADMKHISRSKGSLCLVVQVVVRNTFQDIVGCITKVERARIEIGKKDFILFVDN
jgi:hypothetical protein